MYYHIEVTERQNKSSPEAKVDLTKDQLLHRFIHPYDNGDAIIVNGKTILAQDIERVRVGESKQASPEIIRTLRAEDERSNVIFFRGLDENRVVHKAKDVTDEFITGPPGGKTKKSDDRLILAESNDDSTSKVFVVHGHDHALKSDLEVFLQENGLEAVVLHRKADEGLTLLEKFEKHSDVGFAIILLTPDDAAYPVSERNQAGQDREEERRARQNVIFEFGYFVGKLGRSRVVCLYKEGVTLPSDVNGFLYKKVSNSIEDVGYPLLKELKKAGLPVNGPLNT